MSERKIWGYGIVRNGKQVGVEQTISGVIQWVEAEAVSLVTLSELEAVERQRDELLASISDLELQNKELNGLKRFVFKASAITSQDDKDFQILKIQLEELKTATQLYELALKASWPQGAEGDAFQYWNDARIAADIGVEE